MTMTARGALRMVLAAAAAMAAGAAQAQVSVQDTLWAQTRARLGALNLSIYDATPDDGVAASFRFLDAANAWRTFTYIGVYAPSDSNEDLAFRDQMTFAPHAEPVVAGVQSVGIFTADGFRGAGGAWGLASNEIGAQGQARGLDRAFSAHAGLSSTATGLNSPTFRNLVLGPGTGVRLSAYGITEAWLGIYGESASAYVELMAEFSAPDAMGVYQPALAQRSYDWLHSYLDQDSPEMAMPYDRLVKVMDQRALTLSFENLTDAEMVGRVRFMANGDGVSMVPEPGAAWLLLVGLPLLGRVAGGRHVRRAAGCSQKAQA